MPKRRTPRGSTLVRSRSQRIAAGAVLATTGLLGAYVTALRPQPTYASPSRGGAGQQGDAAPATMRSLSLPSCAQADVTVSNPTDLRDAILASQDDSVICIDGTITLTSDLPVIDDTTVTFVGDDSTMDIINGQDTFKIIRADFSGSDDDTLTVANIGLIDGRYYRSFDSSQLQAAGGGAVRLYQQVPGSSGSDSLHLDSISVASSSSPAYDEDFYLAVMQDGGGVFSSAPAVIANSSFTMNRGRKGGALFLAAGGSISSSVLDDNDAQLYPSNGFPADGGALFAAQAATIAYSTLTNNAGKEGGAIYLGAGGSVASSVLSGNAAQGNGGGIRSSGGDLTISDATFYANSALLGNGGAVYQRGYSVSMSRTSLEGNRAVASEVDPSSQGFGGGLALRNSVAQVSSSSFTGNAADYGGGISSYYLADATISNSFIGGNYSVLAGGGLSIIFSSVTLNFSTLYDDSAGFAPGSHEVVIATGELHSTGSVIGSSTYDGLVALYSGTIDDTYSVTTGTTPVFTGSGSQLVATGSLELGQFDGTGPGQRGRTPAESSVLVSAAPSSGLSTGIADDQLGIPRGPKWTIGARQVGGDPTPPAPAPVSPPSAPRDVTATPGDGRAVVSWKPPASPGSFPVTHYRVTAEPEIASCLVAAPETSCAIAGLRNGQAYTFTVEALNGAGWGSRGGPSSAVVPRPAARRLVLDQGTRVSDGRHDRIRTTGSSIGVPAGVRLTPYIRYSGQASFIQGKATITVEGDGSFRWTRQIRKDRGITAFVAWEDLESNRVFWARIR